VWRKGKEHHTEPLPFLLANECATTRLLLGTP